MFYLRTYSTAAEHSADTTKHNVYMPAVCYIIDDDKVIFHKVTITVQGLIDAGYATTSTSGSMTYIILNSDCPYTIAQITDFAKKLSNTEQIDGATKNTFKWNNALPSTWTATQLANVYTNNQFVNITPQTQLFCGVDLGTADYIELSFAEATWSGIENGLFNTRGLVTTTTCPKTITINFTGYFSSMLQTWFTNLVGTKTLNWNFTEVDCHDLAGMFEYSSDLENINITNASGKWYMQSIRNVTNMFHGCQSLTEIPLGCPSYARDHYYNTIFARVDGIRGTRVYDQTFYNCKNLTSIKPTLNLFAQHTSDLINSPFYNCVKLTDVRIKNLSNCSWDLTTTSGLFLPYIDVDSINYLLNNIATNVSVRYGKLTDSTLSGDEGNTLYWTDSTKTSYTTTTTDYPVTVLDCEGFTLTLNDLYKDEISTDAIASAEAKGWTIQFSHYSA